MLAVCLTLGRGPKTVTANAITLRQKGKPHGKEKKTYGKRNNLTVRQKEKDSRQEEEPHGKKKKTQSEKKKTHGEIYPIPRGHFNSYFFCREVVVILFAVRF